MGLLKYLYLCLCCTGVYMGKQSCLVSNRKDEVSLLRPVGLARLRGAGRGGGGGGDVLEDPHRVVRRMKIEPSSGGEEIRGGSDPLQEIAREASGHALPRRGGKLQKADDISDKTRDELRNIMEEHGF